MSKCISLFLFMLLLTGCKKDKYDSVLVNLLITKAEAPASTTLAEGITANVHCFGPDLCHKFSHFEVNRVSQFQYDIFAKATFPNRPGACALAIYGVDTSLTISTPAKGQYVLRFYNMNSGTTVFITDTVQVH
jgi:hypothetical protein